jgi:hypothetical protein
MTLTVYPEFGAGISRPVDPWPVYSRDDYTRRHGDRCFRNLLLVISP